MSDYTPAQPATTRQFVEEAIRRLVDTRMDVAGSTWQHIVRFFRGDSARARVVYACDPPRIEATEEDGTPAMVSVLLTIRVSSHMQDAENGEHDQVAADIIGLVADSSAIVASLNEAMADEYGDFFNVRYAESQHDATTKVEGKRQVTEIKTTLWLPPAEIALAWAAQNPQ
jgi:hypothetical protein